MRHEREQLLDQLEIRPLKGDVDLCVHHLGGLGLCGFGHGGVAVAEVGDADAAGEVEHFATGGHGHVAAGAGVDYFGREAAYAAGDVAGAEFGEVADRHGGW